MYQRKACIIDRGEFIIEYVGEVLEYAEFRARAKIYSKVDHFYFMALNANEILDAAKKGNASRFINHSCDPNCETQKVRTVFVSEGTQKVRGKNTKIPVVQRK